MRRSYFCPHCDGLLNPGSLVVFVIENQGRRELVLLSPEPGDYAMVYRDTVVLEPGTAYTLCCPICHADLVSPGDDRFLEVTSRTEEGADVRVQFSRIFGQHATYLLSRAGVERFGEHAESIDPVNFFGAGEPTS